MLLPTFPVAVNACLVSRITSARPCPWESPFTISHFPPTSPYLLLFSAWGRPALCLGTTYSSLSWMVMQKDSSASRKQPMVQWCLCSDHWQNPRTSCLLWKSGWFDMASQAFLWLRSLCLLLMTSPVFPTAGKNLNAASPSVSNTF